MRICLILISVVWLGIAATPDHTTVKFHNDFDKAQKIAKKQNQILLVDFTAKWCGACKMMDKEAFSNRRLTRYLGQKAVAVKVDIESLDGLLLKQEHGVTVLPTLLFIYPDGEVAHRTERMMSASEIETIIENFSEDLIYRDPSMSTARKSRAVEDLRRNQEELKKVGFIGQTYKIVLAQTSTYDYAIKLYQKYETELDQRPTIFESNSNGLYSITLGDFDNREDAERAIKRLRGLKSRPMVKAISDL